MAEEFWETVIRKLAEEKVHEEVKRELRLKHADLMVISLRHLDKLLRAASSSSMANPNALVDWSEAWESAAGFIDYVKKEGLI